MIIFLFAHIKKKGEKAEKTDHPLDDVHKLDNIAAIANVAHDDMSKRNLLFIGHHFKTQAMVLIEFKNRNTIKKLKIKKS